ncbi:MAG: hypothetical protein AAGA54_32920 [Myxococcota bacterium]
MARWIEHVSAVAAVFGGLALLQGCTGTCADDGFAQPSQDPGCPAVTGPISQGQTTGGTDADADTSSGTASSSTTAAEDESSGTADSTSTGPEPAVAYCADEDGDGFGTAENCADVPQSDAPPPGWVTDDTDCDDDASETFPGAAQAESAEACMKDLDDDGYGDAAPPEGVVPGLDCVDALAGVFPGAATAEPELCTLDTDADGFGDAFPPEGAEAGTDCIDDNPAAFPGAAELDDAEACMEDLDEDGYGDSLPPPGATAGTDCNDDDINVPAIDACLNWCLDADEDEYGDPEICVLALQPPDGYVGNAADCDDDAPETFPGAAPLDDAEACMTDADGDDYGDDAPAAGVTAGQDCDDAEALTFDGCFDCPADATACSGDDVLQCNATGTFGVPVETCVFGCDDASASCWSALEAEAPVCFELVDGGSTDLSVIASGGDGAYAYAWTPNDSLTPDDAAVVSASPAGTTTYDVVITDGEGNAASARTTAHVVDAAQQLNAPGCASFVYTDIFEDPAAPPPDNGFFIGDTARCNLSTNGLANAYVCPQIMDQARVEFEMQVVNVADDDGIGFVWGWQDASHFYLFSWKGSTETTPWGAWQQGVTIKRIEADAPEDLDAADLASSEDTAHGTILATPDEFFGGGWDNFQPYDVQLDLAGDTSTITIRNGTTDAVIMTGSIVDDALGPGAVGSWDASQRTPCHAQLVSSCLPPP